MAVSNVGDVLDRVQELERRQIEMYAVIRDSATDDGVRLLTHYLARHKRHLPEAFSCFSPDQMKQIRRTPVLEEDVAIDADHYFKGKTISADIKADTLLDCAIEYIQKLLDCFHHMSHQSLGEETLTLFDSLYKIEVKDIVELKKIKAMHYF